MKILKYAAVGLVVLIIPTIVILLIIHRGDYPWILETTAFQILGALVAFNTLIYAFLGSMKLGLKSNKERKKDV